MFLSEIGLALQKKEFYMLQPGAKKLLQPTARNSISTSRIALHNHNQHKAQPNPKPKPKNQPKSQLPKVVLWHQPQQQH
jgi:hypothetical protein